MGTELIDLATGTTFAEVPAAPTPLYGDGCSLAAPGDAPFAVVDGEVVEVADPDVQQVLAADAGSRRLLVTRGAAGGRGVLDIASGGIVDLPAVTTSSSPDHHAGNRHAGVRDREPVRQRGGSHDPPGCTWPSTDFQSPQRIPRLDESRLVCADHGMDAIAHAQLREDVRYMRLHGPLGDEEDLRDFGVRLPA